MRSGVRAPPSATCCACWSWRRRCAGSWGSARSRGARGAGRPLQAPAAGRSAEGAASRDPNVERLEQELAEKLGTRVAIQHGSGGKGKLVVSYNSLDELDGILAHIQ